MGDVNFGGEARKFDADIARRIPQSDEKNTFVLELFELLFAVERGQYYIKPPNSRGKKKQKCWPSTCL